MCTPLLFDAAAAALTTISDETEVYPGLLSCCSSPCHGCVSAFQISEHPSIKIILQPLPACVKDEDPDSWDTEDGSPRDKPHTLSVARADRDTRASTYRLYNVLRYDDKACMLQLHSPCLISALSDITFKTDQTDHGRALHHLLKPSQPGAHEDHRSTPLESGGAADATSGGHQYARLHSMPSGRRCAVAPSLWLRAGVSLSDVLRHNCRAIATDLERKVIVLQACLALACAGTHAMLPHGRLEADAISLEHGLLVQIDSWLRGGETFGRTANAVAEVDGQPDVQCRACAAAPLPAELSPYATPEAATAAWQRREMSNWSYLLCLNVLAGRRWGDLERWPMMPWVITMTHDPRDGIRHRNLEADRPAPGWRNLSTSRLALFKGVEQLDLLYTSTGHHVSDESLSELSTCLYLARTLPLHVLERKVRAPFVATQYAQTVLDLAQSTPDEAVPELYCDPAVFEASSIIGELEIPAWAEDVPSFIDLHRAALESERVSRQLHHWIDLTWGFKLEGDAAQRARNVHLSRQAPPGRLQTTSAVQLFTAPHPQRFPLPDDEVFTQRQPAASHSCGTSVLQAKDAEAPRRSQPSGTLGAPAQPCSDGSVVPSSNTASEHQHPLSDIGRLVHWPSNAAALDRSSSCALSAADRVKTRSSAFGDAACAGKLPQVDTGATDVIADVRAAALAESLKALKAFSGSLGCSAKRAPDDGQRARVERNGADVGHAARDAGTPKAHPLVDDCHSDFVAVARLAHQLWTGRVLHDGWPDHAWDSTRCALQLPRPVQRVIATACSAAHCVTRESDARAAWDGVIGSDFFSPDARAVVCALQRMLRLRHSVLQQCLCASPTPGERRPVRQASASRACSRGSCPLAALAEAQNVTAVIVMAPALDSSVKTDTMQQALQPCGMCALTWQQAEAKGSRKLSHAAAACLARFVLRTLAGCITSPISDAAVQHCMAACTAARIALPPRVVNADSLFESSNNEASADRAKGDSCWSAGRLPAAYAPLHACAVAAVRWLTASCSETTLSKELLPLWPTFLAAAMRTGSAASLACAAALLDSHAVEVLLEKVPLATVGSTVLAAATQTAFVSAVVSQPLQMAARNLLVALARHLAPPVTLRLVLMPLIHELRAGHPAAHAIMMIVVVHPEILPGLVVKPLRLLLDSLIPSDSSHPARYDKSVATAVPLLLSILSRLLPLLEAQDTLLLLPEPSSSIDALAGPLARLVTLPLDLLPDAENAAPSIDASEVEQWQRALIGSGIQLAAADLLIAASFAIANEPREILMERLIPHWLRVLTCSPTHRLAFCGTSSRGRASSGFAAAAAAAGSSRDDAFVEAHETSGTNYWVLVRHLYEHMLSTLGVASSRALLPCWELVEATLQTHTSWTPPEDTCLNADADGLSTRHALKVSLLRRTSSETYRPLTHGAGHGAFITHSLESAALLLDGTGWHKQRSHARLNSSTRTPTVTRAGLLDSNTAPSSPATAATHCSLTAWRTWARSCAERQISPSLSRCALTWSDVLRTRRHVANVVPSWAPPHAPLHVAARWRAHLERVHAAVVCSDEARVLTASTARDASGRGVVRSWHLPHGSPGPQYCGHQDLVTSLAVLNADEGIFASTDASGVLAFWQFSAANVMSSFGPTVSVTDTAGPVTRWGHLSDCTLEASHSHHTCVAAAPWLGHAHALSGTDAGRLCHWDATAGQCLRVVEVCPEVPDLSACAITHICPNYTSETQQPGASLVPGSAPQLVNADMLGTPAAVRGPVAVACATARNIFVLADELLCVLASWQLSSDAFLLSSLRCLAWHSNHLLTLRAGATTVKVWHVPGVSNASARTASWSLTAAEPRVPAPTCHQQSRPAACGVAQLVPPDAVDQEAALVCDVLLPCGDYTALGFEVVGESLLAWSPRAMFSAPLPHAFEYQSAHQPSAGHIVADVLHVDGCFVEASAGRPMRASIASVLPLPVIHAILIFFDNGSVALCA